MNSVNVEIHKNASQEIDEIVYHKHGKFVIFVLFHQNKVKTKMLCDRASQFFWIAECPQHIDDYIIQESGQADSSRTLWFSLLFTWTKLK